MSPEILALSPLPPALAGALIGGGILVGRIRGEAGEPFTARVSIVAALASILINLAGIAAAVRGDLVRHVSLGTWLQSGTYRVDFDVTFDGLSLSLALLFNLLSLVVLRFSVNYMHREDGFHRFFLVLSLFSGAMQMLITAGNALLTFVGWELAGVCSYLLIGYHYERPTATGNATRAFVTNRIGDAGFIAGIALAFIWTGGIEWSTMTGDAAHLREWQAGILACCFLLAAVAKSGQVPLTPWLARAMEGPTPSSAIFYGAVMVHAGVYLVLRLQSLFEQAPLAMGLMAILGLLTALYGLFCGLVQTDVKSALVFSTSGQLGLMFLAAGLGFWRLAFWHLCAHAVVRGYQFLSAPSLMHRLMGIRPRPVHRWLGRSRLLYMAAMQRFVLEDLGDRLAVRPVRELGADLDLFDDQVLESAFGRPATTVGVAASLQGIEKRPLSNNAADDPEILRVSGLPGFLVLTFANACHWFEEKLVLQGTGANMSLVARKLGNRLNQIEELFDRPRYLVMLILFTLLAVF